MKEWHSPKKNILYVSSTYYHALISCVKQLNWRKDADILCTGHIPDGKTLTNRIEHSGLFNRAMYIGSVEEYMPKNRLDYILNIHRKNAGKIESQLPSGFNFSDYKEINIFHDGTWMAHYLKDRRIKYRLVEDALNSFQYLSKTVFANMLPKKGVKAIIKRITHIGYMFLGSDGFAYEIEANEKNGVEFKSKKLVEVPRKPMFDALSDDDKLVLKKIFLKELPLIPQNAALLFTQPLYTDKIVKSENEQIEMYKKFAEEYLSNKNIFIKAHPRDFADYDAAFSNAVVLDKNMPSEILAMAMQFDFSEYVAFPAARAKTGGYIELNTRGFATSCCVANAKFLWENEL